MQLSGFWNFFVFLTDFFRSNSFIEKMYMGVFSTNFFPLISILEYLGIINISESFFFLVNKYQNTHHLYISLMKTALPRATWYKLNFAHFLAPKTYQGTNNKWPDLCSKNFQDMVTYDFTVTKKLCKSYVYM